jgi:hypothetical protein
MPIEQNKIYYESLHKYKYRLYKNYRFNIGIKRFTYLGIYLNLYNDGTCILKSGYCCDGPSGPTIDTKTFMRGAFEHDGGYQLIRLGIIPVSFRKHLDKRLRNTCLEDKMNRFRAWYVYHAVRIGGASSAKPGTQCTKVYSAP